MRIKCPSCNYSGPLFDVKVTPNNTTIVCLKCKFKFNCQSSDKIECNVCKEFIVASKGCHICKDAEKLLTAAKYAKCIICHKKTNKYVTSNGLNYFICHRCNYQMFNGHSGDEIAVVVGKAFELTIRNKLLIAYAINHVLGRYTLEEAKRRTKLKLIEREGGSTDIFDKGSRIPGSFRSRK